MSWTNWQSVATSSGHDSAAVYEIRIVDADGNPFRIPRFLGTDVRGLPSIGESKGFDTRRKKFLAAVETCTGHSEGNLFYYLILHSPLRERFPDHRLQYRYHAEADKAAAKLAENRMIKAYIRKFGEVPPLNSAIPDRYGSWDC